MRVRAQVRVHLVIFLVFYWLLSLVFCMAHVLGQMKMYVFLRRHASFMAMIFPFSQVMHWIKIPESTFLFRFFPSQSNSLSIPALYHTPFLLCCRLIRSFSLFSIFSFVLFRLALSSIPRSSFSKMVIRLFLCFLKIIPAYLDVMIDQTFVSPQAFLLLIYRCFCCLHTEKKCLSIVLVHKRIFILLLCFWYAPSTCFHTANLAALFAFRKLQPWWQPMASWVYLPGFG